MEKGGCLGITRIHRLPSRPSHPYGRQPHSLIFMGTLYKASSRLPAKQLTNDHEPACMCHLYRLRINTHVLTFTMPCFIARHFPTKSWLSNLGFSHTKHATPTAVPYNLMYLCQHVRSCCQAIYIQFITHLSCLHRVLSRE